MNVLHEDDIFDIAFFVTGPAVVNVHFAGTKGHPRLALAVPNAVSHECELSVVNGSEDVLMTRAT